LGHWPEFCFLQDSSFRMSLSSFLRFRSSTFSDGSGRFPATTPAWTPLHAHARQCADRTRRSGRFFIASILSFMSPSGTCVAESGRLSSMLCFSGRWSVTGLMLGDVLHLFGTEWPIRASHRWHDQPAAQCPEVPAEKEENRIAYWFGQGDRQVGAGGA
jgi:hypothetical protein